MVGAGQDDLVPVGFFAELGKAQEYVLVVLAKNWSCLLEKDGVSNRYVIYVDPEDEDDIAREFSAYTEEQLDYGRRAGSPLELPVFQSGAWVAFIWVVLLLACYLLQGIYPSMVGGGLSSSLGMIDRGEWWRPFTALFLHADVSHLLGNIAMGSLFVILVSRSVGVAVGWLLVLAGGVVGNILTAWAHYPAAFHSLGASTAVFGALGILTGYGIYVAFKLPPAAPWAPVILPLGGGVALLGWFGAGGATTDVLGHMLGFASGWVLGIAAAWWRLREIVAQEVPHVRAGGGAA